MIMKAVFFILSFFLVSVSFGQDLPEVSISGVGVYPNPFNEQIFITGKNESETETISKIEIYTEQYQKVLSVNRTNVIDANHLKRGTYFLKIYYPDQVIIRKVVKK